MILFANVGLGGLPDPDGRLARDLAAWWHRDGIRQYEYPAYLTAGIDHLPIPYPPPRACPRPGVLVWPTGASRWSTFHCFATGDQVAAVLSAVGKDDPSERTLIISDGTNGIQPQMRLLEPLPVGRYTGTEFYLLTFVDRRYGWWRRVAKAPAGPSSWADLIQQLFTAVMGSSPSVPPIPAGYKTPDAGRWDVGYKPLPLLIDAALATVGLRMVRSVGGTVSLVAAAAAAAQEAANWQVFEPECLAGGRCAVSDIALGVPAAVRVVFPGPVPVTADQTLAGLALSEFGTAKGVAGQVAFVGADLPAAAAAADRTAYATQAATDYYRRALSRLDGTFRAVCGWTFSGLEDRVEWEQSGDKILTRVYRPPLADRNLYGGPGTPPPPPLGWSFAAAPGVDATADVVPVSLVSITIPEAGTYLLCARVQATINATISPTSGSTAIMVADIFGVDGAVYQTFLCPAVCSAGPGDSGYNVYGSGVIVGVASFVGPTTVTLRGWRRVAGIGLTWNTSRFTTVDSSDNTIQYLKLTGIDLAPGGFTGTVP